MQNPFNHENYPSNELKRNTFPCSFQNNLTMKYGYIYPAGIWRTVPGATYKIRPTLGLNFMPTTFPVQTRQKVFVHYFYGRDRNFWKDYKDFVNGQRPDLVKPYLDESVTKARTGKLLDYLGVPTTIVGSYGNLTLSGTYLNNSGTNGHSLFVSHDLPSFKLQTANIIDSQLATTSYSQESYDSFAPSFVGSTISLVDSFSTTDGIPNTTKLGNVVSFNVDLDDLLTTDLIGISFNSYDVSSTSYINDMLGIFPESYTYNNLTANRTSIDSSPFSYKYKNFFLAAIDINGKILDCVSPERLADNGLVYFPNFNKNIIPNIGSVVLLSGLNALRPYSPDYWSWSSSPLFTMMNVTIDRTSSTEFSVVASPTTSTGLNVLNLQTYKVVSEVRDIDDTNSPYWRSGATTDLRERIKLNAYLPRFYETVYNLYYRNPQNNPYMLEGRPEYNKFIPSKDGGVDSNLYELRRRNWEDDFLTTAVQSPQQGIAPLVGLTDRGATLTLTNEDGTVTRYNVTTSENGSITGFEANDTSAEPVLTKALIDAVSYGISIEDIRNVNAMQKWLELNLRKGYQYKDIIQARWGISISYNELDLPEFIGGFTKDVQLQAVTQTANVNDDVTGQLGWQAGRLYASGEGREITHYCDEEGYIMCLITVVPVPNYSQLLPKHWFERDLLDSYQPEFNHIGFQPITYKEVCPVQAYQESTENVNVLEQTFGYQRPWYQYFNYTDEVHGQFRTTFKDFLINRVFDVKPELSESFLLVDPEQINDVFNVTDAEDDKILGAIYHNCTAKLPISLYAQARLE